VDLLVCLAALAVLVVVGFIQRGRLRRRNYRRYQQVIERGGRTAVLLRLFDAMAALALGGGVINAMVAIFVPSWNASPYGRILFGALLVVGLAAYLIVQHLLESEP
jgi:hypothetical protein